MNKKIILATAVGLLSAFAMQGNAFAALCEGSVNVTTYNKKTRLTTTVSQPYDLSGKVSTASDCYIAGTTNDGVGGSDRAQWTVNTDAFFDVSDWHLDGKFESGSAQLPTLATLAWDAGATNLRGTFTLTEKALDYENIMFVFKSGANTSLVAYLLEPDSGSGTLSTPFVRLPFVLQGSSTQKAISHISVYYSGAAEAPATEVAEPASLALMGMGMLGVASLRRKRTRAK